MSLFKVSNFKSIMRSWYCCW